MAVPTLSRFLEILRLSGLIDEDDLTQFLKDNFGSETPPEETTPQDVAERLLKIGVLTPWHAEKLLDGKYKGFRLGNYRLRDFLGSGGMSSVYLAEHVHMHQSRAVKVLPRKKNDESSRLKRFYLEARASAQLRHNNIVQVYDIDQSGDDIHYIVMEYVKGRDLAKAVREDGPLSFDVCLSYMIQAADALQHAHENGLVHRDVKPGNFLVDDKGTLKCMDLGLALFASQDDHSLTQEFNEKVLGTADYLSPEQAINSHNVDHRADIYSLGCTIYYCLTGSPPFPEGTLAQRILNHQTKMPEDPRTYRPEIPQAFVDLIWRMIQKRPEDRLQTAAAVGAELRRLQTYGWDAVGVGAAAGAAAGSPSAGGPSAGIRPAPSPSGAGGRPTARSGGGSGSSSDIGRSKPPSGIERQAIAARDSGPGRSGPQAASPATSPAANGTPATAPGAGASDAQKALAAIAADHQARRAAALKAKAASDSGRQAASAPTDSGPQRTSPSGAGQRTSPSGSGPGVGQPTARTTATQPVARTATQPVAKATAPAAKPASSAGVRPAGSAVRPATTPASPSDATRSSGPVVVTNAPAVARAPVGTSSSPGVSPAPRPVAAAQPTPTPSAAPSAATRPFTGRSGKKGISPVAIVVGVLGAVALVAAIALAIAFSGGSETPGPGGGGSGGRVRPERRATDTSSLDVPVIRQLV